VGANTQSTTIFLGITFSTWTHSSKILSRIKCHSNYELTLGNSFSGDWRGFLPAYNI